MLARPPLVDAMGINIHTLEDLYIPVLPPLGGSLAARVLSFEFVGQTKRFPLITHPTNPAAKVISVSAADLSRIANGSAFALIDRTASARVKWSGKFRRFS